MIIKDYMSLQAAGKLLGVTNVTIGNMIRNNELKFVRIRKKMFVLKTEIDRILQPTFWSEKI